MEEFLCPENEITGTFPDPDECDKYWSCFKNVSTPKYCADGLAFDPALVTQANPCDLLFKVDCTGRETLGDPLGTGVCYRQNGVYAHENPDVCDQYYICTDDAASSAMCPPGLHFREDTKMCDWPHAANRGDCGALRSLPDGFSCDPNVVQKTAAGQPLVHTKFAHSGDCTKFYVCKNKIDPALSGCDEGLVFNQQTYACDVPENVPEW